MTRESIIEKIKNLLELSANNSNENEAKSAMLMAQKLMAKHDISSDALDTQSSEIEDIIEVSPEHKWDAGFRKPLACIISENYKCKCFMRGNQVIFIGHESDAIIARAAFEFAYKFIQRRGNALYEQYRNNGMTTRGVFNSYAVGFLKGLREVLEAQSTALMIVVPQDVVDEFNAHKFAGSSGGGISGSGYRDKIAAQGYKDAKERYAAPALTSSSISSAN